jgi:hypothetical protein
VQVIPGELKRKWKQLLPQFDNFSSWAKLDSFDLAWILCLCPECVRQVPLNKLSSEDWETPLHLHERVLRPFWTVRFGSSSEISKLLHADPSLIQYVDVSQCMVSRDWWSVLDEHPDLVRVTPVSFFVDMPTKLWVNVLKEPRPSWVEAKAPWHSLSGSNWAKLLHSRPELETHCEWRKLGESDWNAILLAPSSPSLWYLIHDVLSGRNLICILEHPELLTYLDWDTAPLLGLRALIIGSSLEIQPPSWCKFSARILSEKSFWRSFKSVHQFVPPSIQVDSHSWPNVNFGKADLKDITESENKLALFCFMGWELGYFASGIKMEEMNPTLLVKYPGIFEKHGWEKVPAEMHYEIVRMAPWLREYYQWTEWTKGKLRRLFDTDHDFITEYRNKYPWKYIFIEFQILILVTALAACSIGLGMGYWLYVGMSLQRAINANRGSSGSTLSTSFPDSVSSPYVSNPNELIDSLGKENNLEPFNNSIAEAPHPKKESSLPPSDLAILYEPETIPVKHQPTGAARISAFAADSIGERYHIDAVALLSLSRPDPPVDFSTNAGLPCLWQDVAPGDYHLNIDAKGFQRALYKITIIPNTTNQFKVLLRPIPVKVEFVFPSANTVCDVYTDAGFLGTSATAHEIPWFIPHIITFKALGWRDKRVKFQITKYGRALRHPITMERVSSVLSVSVTNISGAMPDVGSLSVNGSPFKKVPLPFVRSTMINGTVSLVLSVEGYNVVNSPQQVVLVDRATNNVVFIIDRKPLVRRLFGP